MGKYTLPALNYGYDELEPAIDAKTMEIHHTKHHQAYIDKLNAALEGHTDLQDMNITDLLTNLDEVPDDIRSAVRNHGGGYYNHMLFWTMMAPGGNKNIDSKLEKAISSEFGSLKKLQEEFNAEAGSVFGSGWAWLVSDASGKLSLVKKSNQDNPISDDSSLKILLGVDVWEHAYYLKYQNKRPDYITAWWQVVNWEQVSKNYQ